MVGHFLSFVVFFFVVLLSHLGQSFVYFFCCCSSIDAVCRLACLSRERTRVIRPRSVQHHRSSWHLAAV